jgi:4-hydroxymandelate synthase
MQIQGTDHIELYVGDARQTAYFLCTAFGFRVCGQGGPETGLAGQRSLLLGQGDVRILLTSGLVPDHPAARYVAVHGDGVASIGFSTADAAAAYDRAVSAGATHVQAPTALAREDDEVVTAVVSGFGDVVHRLIQRTGPRREFLPGIIDMMAPDPEQGDDLLGIIDHVAVCLPAGGLDATVRHYRDAFGFAQIYSEYVEVGRQGMDSRVVQSPSSGVTFTLLEPDPGRERGQLDDFLDWHGGAGVQHVAFATHDIVTAVRTFSGRGIGFAITPSSYYDQLEERVGRLAVPVAALRRAGILVDSDQWGQLLQIFTQSMHIRRTLFLELIERRGARTFGSSNIKALYEAKERELAAQRITESGHPRSGVG